MLKSASGQSGWGLASLADTDGFGSRAKPIAIAGAVGLAAGAILGLVIAAKLSAPETAVKV